MKIRLGFVSNSSSSSFIVSRHRLTDEQFAIISEMYETSEIYDDNGKIFHYNSDVLYFTGMHGTDEIHDYLNRHHIPVLNIDF